jgi:hypothetical protein
MMASNRWFTRGGLRSGLKRVITKAVTRKGDRDFSSFAKETQERSERERLENRSGAV